MKATFDELAATLPHAKFRGHYSTPGSQPIAFWANGYELRDGMAVVLNDVCFDASLRHDGITLDKKLTHFDQFIIIGAIVTLHPQE